MERKSKLIKKVITATLMTGMLASQSPKLHANPMIMNNLYQYSASRQALNDDFSRKQNQDDFSVYDNETSFDKSYLPVQPEYYNSEEAVDILYDVLSSSLNDLSKQDSNDSAENALAVKEEVSVYLNRMNANSKALAFIYKNLADKSFDSLGLSARSYADYNHYYFGINNKNNDQVKRSDFQEMLRQYFDMQTLLRLGSKDINQFMSKKSNLVIHSKNDSYYRNANMYKLYDSRSVVAGVEKYDNYQNLTDGYQARQAKIMSYIYSYVENESDKTAANAFVGEFSGHDRNDRGIFGIINDIQNRRVNKNAINTLNERMTKAAECLSEVDEDTFGPVNVSKGLVAEFTLEYATNCLLEHLKEAGYNVDEFRAEMTGTRTFQTEQELSR